jgi:hypothetical protein
MRLQLIKKQVTNGVTMLGDWIAYGGVKRWTPADLFANGEPGFWYDPSDLSTMFQDSAGSIPMEPVGTVPDQPVGLILDKSQGLALGPDLVVNGDFSNGTTGWTFEAGWSVTGGKAVATAVTNSAIYQEVTGAEIGVTYLLEFDLSGITSGEISVQLSNNGEAVQFYSNGRKQIRTVFVNNKFVIFLGLVSFTGSVDNISIREIPGNHATQATAGKRPLLKKDAQGANYLFFDGVDDSLATASFAMTSTSKATVFSGYANGKTGSTGTQLEFSANYMNNNGSMALLVPSLSTSNVSFGSRGTLGAGEKDSPTAPAGGLEKRVLTAYQDFATLNDYGCDYIRANGIPLQNLNGVGNSDVGAGPFGTYPAYIGARAGTANFMLGHVYGLALAGNGYDTETMVKMENWLDGKLYP